MKKLIPFFFFILAFTSIKAQEQIKWLTYDEARVLQKIDSKPILMYVVTHNCYYCRQFEENSLVKDNLYGSLSEKYHLVKFDIEGNEVVNYRGVTYTNPKYKKSGSSSTIMSHNGGVVSKIDRRHDFAKKVLSVEGVPSFIMVSQLEHMSTPIMVQGGNAEFLKQLDKLKEREEKKAARVLALKKIKKDTVGQNPKINVGTK